MRRFSVILMPCELSHGLMADLHASEIRGLPVILPNGRLLGTVYDSFVNTDDWSCTHIFVSDPPADLVEGRTHLAIPWKWVRSVGDVVLLRWFPPTPLPKNL